MNTTHPQVTVKQHVRNGCLVYIVKRLVNYTALSIGKELSFEDLDRLVEKRINVIIN